MIYYVALYNKDKEALLKGYSTSLQAARVKAMKSLIANDIKGQIALIYNKNKEWVGTVSMQIDERTYVKPSIGLKNGMKFMWDDTSWFYDCYPDGRVKAW